MSICGKCHVFMLARPGKKLRVALSGGHVAYKGVVYECTKCKATIVDLVGSAEVKIKGVQKG